MEEKDVESGHRVKNYIDLPAVPLTGIEELTKWSFYRAVLSEFTATGLFLYVTMLTVVGAGNSKPCGGVGTLGVAWAFGGMIFLLVYSTAGISGGHMNPAVTFGFLLARKISLLRTLLYMIAQCLGAISGACLVKGLQKDFYLNLGGGANLVSHGYCKGAGLAAEIMGTFVLVFTVFSATDPKRMARDSHVPVLAPLPIGFAVFTVHLATIPITGTGINPARSLGAAVALNMAHAWNDQWIFWIGPLIGSALATLYHEYVMRSAKVSSIYRSSSRWPSAKEVLAN